MPLDDLKDFARPPELVVRDHYRVTGPHLHGFKTEPRRHRDFLSRPAKLNDRETLRATARGRHRQGHIAPVFDAVILRDVNRGSDRREVRDLPIVFGRNVNAFHAIHAVTSTRLGLDIELSNKVFLRERDRRDAIVAGVGHDLATRVSDEASHR